MKDSFNGMLSDKSTLLGWTQQEWEYVMEHLDRPVHSTNEAADIVGRWVESTPEAPYPVPQLLRASRGWAPRDRPYRIAAVRLMATAKKELL